jgi:hypothetical protein
VDRNTRALPILETILDSYRFVSDHLRLLMHLGRGPAVVALLLSAMLGLDSGFQVTPIYAIANVVAYGWFAFYVFRIVLLGPDKAQTPAPPRRAGEAAAKVRSPIAGFMGRALALGAGALGVFFLLTVVITVPLTLLDHVGTSQPVAMQAPSYDVIDMLLISVVMFCLPVGIPLARFSPALAAAAIDRDTGFGVALRISRGYGLRLTVIWILLAGPFFFGYALLNVALAQVTEMTGGSLTASFVTLLLITAIGMTVTALLSFATARGWQVMTVDRNDGDADVEQGWGTND